MKTNTGIFAILVAGLTSSHAQDTWTQKGDFEGTARSGAVGFSIASKGYIGTGYDNITYQSDFWEFDPSTNAWAQKANFGGIARVGAIGFSIGSKGYIGVGIDGSFRLKNDFWEFDPSTNVWTQKANFGGTARTNAVGFSIGTKGYVGTGSSLGSLKKDFWEYDPSTDTWTQKADFGGQARFDATGLSIGIKGYIGTGDDFSVQYKDFWEYNPATDTWTQKADFAGGGVSRIAGFSIGNKGYLGTSPFFTTEFWEYAPATNAWTQKANFGGTARLAAVGFSIGGKGYLGTGIDSNYSFYNDFWEYTPEGNVAYRDAILADNPIMYWRLGEPCKTIAYDESANHRDATYIHRPTHGLPGAIANDPNAAVGFDGINQHVRWMPTSSYSGVFTVEAWVRERQVHPVETFFDTRSKTAEFSFDFKLDTLAGKEIHFDVGDGTQWLSTSSVPFDFESHVWYYVAAVVTTNSATYYVNGSALGSVVYNGTPLLFDPTHAVQIGTNTRYDTEWFDGTVDEVAVYDHALTADQIAVHYATGTEGASLPKKSR